MAWDDTKSNAVDPDNPTADEQLTGDEWNNHVTDQKTRITASGTDTLTNKTINALNNTVTGLVAADISDFDTEVSANSDVTTNSAKVTNANHSGDATGATALTLATVNSDVGSYTAANITVNAKGLITAAANGSGGGGAGNTIFTFAIDGELSTGTKTFYAIPDELNTLVVKEVRLLVLALPTGADIKVDVTKNGTATTDSIYTSDVPQEIPTGQTTTNGVYQTACGTSSRVGTPGTTLDSARDDVASDDVLYVIIRQIGSSLSGSDLRVQITFGAA